MGNVYGQECVANEEPQFWNWDDIHEDASGHLIYKSQYFPGYKIMGRLTSYLGKYNFSLYKNNKRLFTSKDKFIMYLRFKEELNLTKLIK